MSVDTVTDNIGKRAMIRQSKVPVCFPANYSESFMILFSIISKNINLGNLHPIGIDKLLAKNFEGVISIVPAGLQRSKVVLVSTKDANMCIYSS